MNKKLYVAPELEEIMADTVGMLAASPTDMLDSASDPMPDIQEVIPTGDALPTGEEFV